MRERGFCWSRSGCLAGWRKSSFPCLANQALWLTLTSTLECKSLGLAPRTSEVPCWSVAWFSFWPYSLSTCLLIKSAPVYPTKAVGWGQSWSDLHLHTGQWTYDMKYLINAYLHFPFVLYHVWPTHFWRLHYCILIHQVLYAYYCIYIDKDQWIKYPGLNKLDPAPVVFLFFCLYFWV